MSQSMDSPARMLQIKVVCTMKSVEQQQGLGDTNFSSFKEVCVPVGVLKLIGKIHVGQRKNMVVSLK